MSLWLFDVEVEIAPASEQVLFSLDVPRSGTTIYGDQLEVIGWAFARDASAPAVEIEVQVGGRASTRVTPAQLRDDVAAAFPQLPHAHRSGFALLASIPRAPRTDAAVFVVLGDQRFQTATIRLAGRSRQRWSGANAPLVSVVIPCYNQARFLDEAVASVRGQTYPRVELIVIDDGSTDDTSAVAASLGVSCIRQENRGLAAARNRGAAVATGEYLVFLDADDRLLPHALEANLDAIAERPDAALVCGWLHYLMSADEPLSSTVSLFETEPNEVVGLIAPPTMPERDHYKALLENSWNILCPASVMYRREVFRAAGGFDGSYHHHEDYDLYFRLLREHPIVSHSVPVVEYRRRPGTMSRESADMLESAIATLRDQRAWVRNDEALRAACERGVAVRGEFFGEQVAADLQSAVRGRDWRVAGRDAWVLARRYPRGLAHAIRAPRPPASKKRVLARAQPVERLREYLRTLRVLLGQTRNEVQASRVELAGHLTRLETLASAQLEQLEKLTAAGGETRIREPGQAAGAPEEQVSDGHDWLPALNARVGDQIRALAQIEKRLGVIASPRRSEESASPPVQPDDVLAGTVVTPRADSQAGPPRLTVIMSTYNQEQYVSSAIESVFAQRTDFPIQLIITDDASTDSTPELVETFRARRPELVTVIRSERNGRYFANVLRALALTKSDYFTLLDADDYWTDETYLQRAVDFLDGHPEFVIYSASVVCLHTDGSRVPYFSVDAPDDEFTFEDYLQNRVMPAQTTATLFRNVFFKSGVPRVFAEMLGTDDEYAFIGDWDRYMIHLEKGKARFENRAVGVYRMGVGMWTRLSDLERALWGPRARLRHWRYFGYRHPEFFLSQAVAESDRCLELMRDLGSDHDTEIVVKPEHVADLRDMVEKCRSHLASLTYDPEFFARNREGSARSAEAILSLAFDLIRPASVIDVGCGIGVWLVVASRLGARRVLGIDGPWVQRDALLIPAESFLEHDLETRVPRQRRFDLAVCVEVAEHLDPARGDSLVEDLCELADVVLFSAAIPGQGGDAHHNEQWPPYWRDRFARRKYALVDCFRPQLWDDDQVEWWYAQNTFLYVNADRLTADRRLQAAVAESPQMLLSVVHPRLFEKYSPPWAPPDPEPPHQGST